MARWLFLAAFAVLLLIACAQAASSPTAAPSPVAALPSSSASAGATSTAAATDTLVPSASAAPTTPATDILVPTGTPTVLITPTPGATDQSTGHPATSTPGKTDQPTDHPATATPSPQHTAGPTKTPSPSTQPTAPHTPSPSPTKKPTASPTTFHPTPTPSPSPTPKPSPTATPTVPPHDITIVSATKGFSPSNFTNAHVGVPVVWYQADSHHTVTATDQGQNWGSNGIIAHGATYSHTFDAPGTYRYFCAIHNNMTGTIVVNP